MTAQEGQHHLTMTGYHAGRILCGRARADLRATETTSHVPYTHTVEFLARPEICPECLRVWHDAD